MKFQLLYSLITAATATAQTGNGLAELLASKNSTLSSLSDLLATQPNLLAQLADARNITIFAPSNDALKNFLNSSSTRDLIAKDSNAATALLSYHVLGGAFYAQDFSSTPKFLPSLLSNQSYTNVSGGQVVEGASMDNGVKLYSALRQQSNITESNLNFTGGVLHVINQVLQIPKTISNTAIDANLTSVAGALKKADLITDLDEERDVTIFAPNNEAFAAIGSVLGNISQDDLKKVLQYHVVRGSVKYSPQLASMNDTLETMQGQKLSVSVNNDSVYVNQAKVVKADILVANGVLHIVDGVLNPENPTATANPSDGTPKPAFPDASSVSSVGVPFTSGISVPVATPTDLVTSTSTEAGAKPTAAVAMGALLGGAAVIMNL